ncbi:reverse transcriptase [Gossypium australe]|uniref:Reverse transcriptase n=1 Tax=Gossypium australe TaxID=47621 RepID=A0A5B6VEA3_9ROSI|nr:reverse transcriptase [Gossypium australe]
MVSFIRNYLRELEGVKEVSQITSKVKTKWRSPSGLIVKINFDGLLMSDPNIRDSSGHVLISNVDLHNGVASAFAVEAIACRKATQIVIEMQKWEVIIEGDSLTIIKKSNKGGFDRSLIGSYINDIHILKSRVTGLIFEFVPRSANTLAHILATEALKRKEGCYLTDGVPCYAESQMKEDSVREPD